MATGKAEVLLTVLRVPSAIQRQRAEIFKGLKDKTLEETKWHRDDDLRLASDGRHLLFSRSYEHGGDVAFVVPLHDRQHPVALPGRFPRALDVRGADVLVFDNVSFSLFVHNLRSERISRLADQVFVSAAAFSPDGREVAAFVEDHRTNVPSLWIMNRDGSNKRALRVSARVQDIAWSLDGWQVLFTRSATVTDIWTIGTDGSHLKRLAVNAAYPRVVRLDAAALTLNKAVARAVTKPMPSGASGSTVQNKADSVPPRSTWMKAPARSSVAGTANGSSRKRRACSNGGMPRAGSLRRSHRSTS